MTPATNKFKIAAFYHFAALSDFEALREPLKQILHDNDVRGLILLAPEGINGTMCGPPAGIDVVLDWIRSDDRLSALQAKFAFAHAQAFKRVKVKLKREIVNMGCPEIDPTTGVGEYVAPSAWNALISDPETIVIDTRNAFEVALGTFEGATDPDTRTFQEFPEFVKQHLDPAEHKKVAMFCTGGIRCEKATAFMLQQGFEHVYHLQGGILKYLEEIPESQSMWQGECFVFDERVAVQHELREGDAKLCRPCGRALTLEDMSSEHYIENTSCPYCVGSMTPRKQQRINERVRQETQNSISDPLA